MSSSTLPDTFKLDPITTKKIVGDAKEIMVYGFGHAHYKSVQTTLLTTMTTVIEVFDWNIGKCSEHFISKETGRLITKLQHKMANSSKGSLPQICKNGIANLFLENYKRHLLHERTIPLIFCIESNTEKNSQYKVSVEKIASKELSLKKVVTFAELRRLAKICDALKDSDEPELQKLCEIAKAQVKIVHVDLDPISGLYSLKEVVHPWNDSDWKRAWDQRIQLSHGKTHVEHEKNSSKVGWRAELVSLMKEFKKEVHDQLKQSHTIMQTLKLSPEDFQKVYITLREIYYKILNQQSFTAFYPTFNDFLILFSSTKIKENIFTLLSEAQAESKISKKLNLSLLFQTPIQTTILQSLYDIIENKQNSAIASAIKCLSLKSYMQIEAEDPSTELTFPTFKERFIEEYAKFFIDELEEKFPGISQIFTVELLLKNEILPLVSSEKPVLEAIFESGKKTLYP